MPRLQQVGHAEITDQYYPSFIRGTATASTSTGKNPPGRRNCRKCRNVIIRGRYRRNGSPIETPLEYVNRLR